MKNIKRIPYRLGPVIWMLATTAAFGQLNVDSNGSVGVGTSSPGAKLDVVGDGTSAVVITARSRQTNAYWDLVAGTSDDAVGEFAFERTGANAGNLYIGGNATGNIVFRSGGYTGKMLISAAGNVGIGNSSPGFLLDVGDRIRLRAGSSGTAGLWLYNGSSDIGFIGDASNGNLGLWGNSGAGWGLLMNTTNGNVGIGNGSPAYKLDVNGSAQASAWLTPSDRRLKVNIRNFSASGAIIDALQPREFDWKEGAAGNVGFIAQELYEVFPQAVGKGDDDPETISQPWGVDASKLIPILVAEIQSLRARVAALESEMGTDASRDRDATASISPASFSTGAEAR